MDGLQVAEFECDASAMFHEVRWTSLSRRKLMRIFTSFLRTAALLVERCCRFLMLGAQGAGC